MATPWSVPRMWAGRTVLVMATGPSIPDLVRQLPPNRAGAASVAVNDAFRLAPWADMLYAADPAWWRHHAQDALRFAGLKATANDSCEFRAVRALTPTGVQGFDEDPGCVRTGGNSGYQAVHVAIHAGASRVLLLGFDMHGGHYFGNHPPGLSNTSEATYQSWLERFDALNGRGAEIVNCTPGSALTCFRRADLRAEISA